MKCLHAQRRRQAKPRDSYIAVPLTSFTEQRRALLAHLPVFECDIDAAHKLLDEAAKAEPS